MRTVQFLSETTGLGKGTTDKVAHEGLNLTVWTGICLNSFPRAASPPI
jgi:hypothetical protein